MYAGVPPENSCETFSRRLSVLEMICFENVRLHSLQKKYLKKKTFIYFQTFVSFCSRGILGNLAEFFQCSFCGLVKYVRIDWKTEFSYEKYRQRGKQTV